MQRLSVLAFLRTQLEEKQSKATASLVSPIGFRRDDVCRIKYVCVHAGVVKYE
ncbi:hypothetical protein Goarm_003958, partial [Gossypium armourianum]|nr:hypothetical protein [Gossypium armourianum]